MKISLLILGMDDINSKKDLEKKVEEELKEEKEKKIEGEYIDAIIKKAIENTEFEIDPGVLSRRSS